MHSLLFKLIFWGLMITIGSQTGFGIFEMRDKMREMALEQVSKPWPKLKPAPHVDHSVNPYERKKNASLSDILGF